MRGFSLVRLLDFRPMSTVSDRVAPAPGIPLVPGLLILALGGLLLLFRDSLGLMVGSWWSVKHSHGGLMPGLVIALLCLRPGAYVDSACEAATGAWAGILLLILSAGLLVFGELSAVYTLSHFGFIVALWGLVLSVVGLARLRHWWLPLLCLLFMVPLPQFLSNQLIAFLQLMAALPGTLLIRATGFAAVLEGNLLDVGVYQVPVTEACSSVLMFLPLLSLALPAAVLFRGRWWWRIVLLLSALFIPILIAMLRLAGTGWLARVRGAESAERFLQLSSGAPLYRACVALLLLLITWLVQRSGQTLAGAFGLIWPIDRSSAQRFMRQPAGRPLWTAVVLIGLLALVSTVVSRPVLQVPERQRFMSFPQQIADWQGRTGYVDPAALASLKLADHLALVYQRPTDPRPVSLWVAWYDTQVHGASVHSPLACLPGAGWRVETLDTYTIPATHPGERSLRVNRAIITLGTQRQLVYYWFAQRGRELTSEYLLKWYLFQDGLLMQRSDGALIRVTTDLSDLADMPAADARLTGLVRTIMPVLPDYVPGAGAPLRNPLLNKP